MSWSHPWLFFSHLSPPRTQIHGWKDQEGRNGVATLPGINQYSTQNPVILILCAPKALFIIRPYFFCVLFKKNPSKMRINTAFRTDLVAVVLCKARCPFTAKIEFNAYWSFDRCLKTTLIVIANTCRSTFTCQVLYKHLTNKYEPLNPPIPMAGDTNITSEWGH